ncbi:hypothetical protein PVK06_026791 [Gossypium arboreum]|uniref:Putative plant transposon protein domain-containing protein n=1 Tax=Gossypium arboreum TaxID=29729 RepID=A0ABR0NYP2_GOSAR|nr:hypothetical protein PVK06_026791 [Gossypium arboreum]
MLYVCTLKMFYGKFFENFMPMSILQIPLLSTNTAEGLAQVLDNLCIEGKQWSISNQECYTVQRALLKPIGKIWYHLLWSRLMSSPHNTIVSKERMLLLHSIIKGIRINDGRLLFQKVHRCAEKNAGSLNFPSLITTLYRTVRVPLNKDEDISPNKGGLSRTIFAKI